MSSIAEVRTTEKPLTRNIAAVVEDLIQRHDLTADSFAQLTGTSRVMLQRKLAGAIPFRMSDLVGMAELGWAKPSQILAAAERGELYPPATGRGSLPLTTWQSPAWAEDEPTFDTGCLYVEHVAVHGGGTVTLTQTDQLEYDTESRTYLVIRQPATFHIRGNFECDVLSIEDARTMVSFLEDTKTTPITIALLELLAAYDSTAETPAPIPA